MLQVLILGKYSYFTVSIFIVELLKYNISNDKDLSVHFFRVRRDLSAEQQLSILASLLTRRLLFSFQLDPTNNLMSYAYEYVPCSRLSVDISRDLSQPPLTFTLYPSRLLALVRQNLLPVS